MADSELMWHWGHNPNENTGAANPVSVYHCPHPLDLASKMTDDGKKKNKVRNASSPSKEKPKAKCKALSVFKTDMQTNSVGLFETV